MYEYSSQVPNSACDQYAKLSPRVVLSGGFCSNRGYTRQMNFEFFEQEIPTTSKIAWTGKRYAAIKMTRK